MKFNLKRKLTALAVVAAASGPGVAGAAIQLATGGNSNLVFSAWDTKGTATETDDVGYTRDLGLFLNDFASAAATPVLVANKISATTLLNFDADPTFATFFASANKSTLLWNVAASDTSGNKRILTTVNGGAPTLPTNFDFTGIAGQFDAYGGAVNSLGTHPTVTDGSNTSVPADGAAYSGGLSWAEKWGGKTSFINAGTVGQTLDFWLLYQTTGNGNPVGAKQFQFNPEMGWTLTQNGQLVYSVQAVPEPGTWAMLMAGVLALGAVARRRL